MDILAELPPFEDRHYGACEQRLAVSGQEEVVIILDWLRTHPVSGHRVFMVRCVDTKSASCGFTWAEEEQLLTPVFTLASAAQDAAAWRAAKDAAALAQATNASLPQKKRQSRL